MLITIVNKYGKLMFSTKNCLKFAKIKSFAKVKLFIFIDSK